MWPPKCGSFHLKRPSSCTMCISESHFHGIADFRTTKISRHSTVNNDFKAWSARPAGFMKVKHACSLSQPPFLNCSNSFPFREKTTDEFRPRPQTQLVTFCGKTNKIYRTIPLLFVLYLQIKCDDRNSLSLSLWTFQEFLLFKAGKGNHPSKNNMSHLWDFFLEVLLWMLKAGCFTGWHISLLVFFGLYLMRLCFDSHAAVRVSTSLFTEGYTSVETCL